MTRSTMKSLIWLLLIVVLFYWKILLTRQFSLLTESEDRKSTRLNSSHGYISYAVFCLKKKNKLLLRNEYLADVYVRPLLFKSSERIRVQLHLLQESYLIYNPLLAYYLGTTVIRLAVSR